MMEFIKMQGIFRAEVGSLRLTVQEVTGGWTWRIGIGDLVGALDYRTDPLLKTREQAEAEVVKAALSWLQRHILAFGGALPRLTLEDMQRRRDWLEEAEELNDAAALLCEQEPLLILQGAELPALGLAEKGAIINAYKARANVLLEAALSGVGNG